MLDCRELYPPGCRAGVLTVPGFPLACFDLRHTGGSARQDKACDSFELVGVQPGSVLVTPIDDHAGSFTEISPSHHRVAGGTATIFDAMARGVSAIDSRRAGLSGSGPLAGEGTGSIDERLEYVFGRPQAVAFGTFLDQEPADFASRHPTFATRTAKLGRVLEGNLRLESNPTGQTEAGVIEVARHALRTDQASTLWRLGRCRIGSSRRSRRLPLRPAPQALQRWTAASTPAGGVASSVVPQRQSKLLPGTIGVTSYWA